MKQQSVRRLFKKYLQPYLENFSCSRHLVFVDPIQEMVRGLCFESSGFSAEDFYLWVFVQPLYIPCEYIYFTFGHRLKSRTGVAGWTITEANEADVMADVSEAIQNDGLPFLESFQIPADIVEGIEEFGGLATDMHKVEAVAYSLILADRVEESIPHLHRLHDMCANYDPLIEWPREVMRRGDRILKTLETDVKQARRILYEWRSYTLRELKLEEFAAPIQI